MPVWQAPGAPLGWFDATPFLTANAVRSGSTQSNDQIINQFLATFTKVYVGPGTWDTYGPIMCAGPSYSLMGAGKSLTTFNGFQILAPVVSMGRGDSNSTSSNEFGGFQAKYDASVTPGVYSTALAIHGLSRSLQTEPVATGKAYCGLGLDIRGTSGSLNNLGSGATATAVESGGVITSVTSTAAGTGYQVMPAAAPSNGVGAYILSWLGIVSISSAGGTGFANGDTITLPVTTQGAAITATQAVLTVLTNSGGNPTSFTLTQPGQYSDFIATTLAQTAGVVTSGSGTGATFTLAWGITSYTVVDGGFGASSPTLTIAAGTRGEFSNIYNDWDIRSFTNRAVDMRGTGSSGSIWNNFYINGSAGTFATAVFWGTSQGDTINQLNIESMTLTGNVVQINSDVCPLHINSLHMELLTCTGNNKSFVALSGNTANSPVLIIDDWVIATATLTAPTTFGLLTLSESNRVLVHNFREFTNTVSCIWLPVIAPAAVSNATAAEFNNARYQLTTGGTYTTVLNLAPASQALCTDNNTLVLRRFNDQTYSAYPGRTHPGYISGKYYTPTPYVSGISSAVVATTVTPYALPMYLADDTSLSAVSMRIGTGQAGGAFIGGIYSNTPGTNRPGSLIVQGASAAATSNNVNVDSAFTATVLKQGWYWIVTVWTATTTLPTVITNNTQGTGLIGAANAVGALSATGAGNAVQGLSGPTITYASGLSSTFGSPTEVTGAGVPYPVFKVT